MRTSTITLAALAVATIALSVPAEARHHRNAQFYPIFDAAAAPAYPIEHQDRAPRASRAVSRSVEPAETAHHSQEEAEPARQPSHGLVSIQCGKGHIKVAATAAVQFAGFCRDLWAVYHWAKGQGGWRPGVCATGSKHPCGGAIDVEQWCRSCVTKAFPVKLSEQLADKWGLWPGSRWGYRDTGHFEIRGGLASNGWKPKDAAKIAALPPEPAPKHWPITAKESAPVLTAEAAKAALPSVAFYAYEEIVEERPAKIVLAALRDVPIGTPRQEVDRAADAFGLDRTYMRAVAKIESDFNPHERTGQYIGIFQLSHNEFASYGEGSITSARDNAVAAAAKFVSERVEFERAVRRNADRGDLYLVHLQGLRGAIEHIDHPERIAWRSMCATDEGREKGDAWCRKAVWGNVLPHIKRVWKSVEVLTSGTFTAMWRDRLDALYRGGITTPAKVAKAEPHRHRHHRHHYVRHHHMLMASR